MFHWPTSPSPCRVVTPAAENTSHAVEAPQVERLFHLGAWSPLGAPYSGLHSSPVSLSSHLISVGSLDCAALNNFHEGDCMTQWPVTVCVLGVVFNLSELQILHAVTRRAQHVLSDSVSKATPVLREQVPRRDMRGSLGAPPEKGGLESGRMSWCPGEPIKGKSKKRSFLMQSWAELVALRSCWG